MPRSRADEASSASGAGEKGNAHPKQGSVALEALQSRIKSSINDFSRYQYQIFSINERYLSRYIELISQLGRCSPSRIVYLPQSEQSCFTSQYVRVNRQQFFSVLNV